MKKIDIACIIDDDPIFVYGQKKIMLLANFCKGFLVFHNGKEALDYLKPILEKGEKTPDIILLDINMPVMDGWEFLDHFTKISTKQIIKIYLVTSSINPADKQRAKEYEKVSNFIVKPISADQLNQISDDFESG